MEYRSLASNIVISNDDDTCRNQCAEELAPNVAQEELRKEKQMGWPVNCSDSELSIYLQALEEGFLATYYSDTNPSVQSKSMSIASRSYQRGKKTVAFHGFQSLQMSLNLTGNLGEELLIWFLEGFRARTLVQPARAPESPESGQDSGVKWLELLAKYDPNTHSWKTAQLCLLGDSELSSVIWPKSGMTQNGQCWVLPMLGRLIKETESGLGRKSDLAVAVKMYPTPTVQDASNNGSESQMERNSKPLNAVVGGSLNPTWVEKLMGWPDDWTSLQPISHVKMCFWLMGMSDGTKTGRNEVLRVLRLGNAAQEIQREIGRPVGIPEAALLLAELCEHANRPDEARVFMACAEALEEEVRGVQLCEGTTGAPHRPGQDQQRSGEHPDTVQALSRLLAHHGQTYWQDGRWEDAKPRVANGVAARVDRLKAIGNGQVPAVAATAWRLLGDE